MVNLMYLGPVSTNSGSSRQTLSREIEGLFHVKYLLLTKTIVN